MQIYFLKWVAIWFLSDTVNVSKQRRGREMFKQWRINRLKVKIAGLEASMAFKRECKYRIDLDDVINLAILQEKLRQAESKS